MRSRSSHSFRWICEDLAHYDDLARLIRSVNPTIVATVLSMLEERRTRELVEWDGRA